MNTRHVLLTSAAIGALLTVSSGVPVGPSWALNNPLTGVVKSLTDDAKRELEKEARKQADIAIKKLREAAHKQLENQIRQAEENLRQQVEQIWKS